MNKINDIVSASGFYRARIYAQGENDLSLFTALDIVIKLYELIDGGWARIHTSNILTKDAAKSRVNCWLETGRVLSAGGTKGKKISAIFIGAQKNGQPIYEIKV